MVFFKADILKEWEDGYGVVYGSGIEVIVWVNVIFFSCLIVYLKIYKMMLFRFFRNVRIGLIFFILVGNMKLGGWWKW